LIPEGQYRPHQLSANISEETSPVDKPLNEDIDPQYNNNSSITRTKKDPVED